MAEAKIKVKTNDGTKVKAKASTLQGALKKLAKLKNKSDVASITDDPGMV